ncbi:MAG: 50S ribosomal protein L35 [bacterium]|nr:50S ribosomal protein L35 [bacterium]
MAKTNKSLMKRIKITGTGKIMKRPPGQNHFNAKDSGSKGQRKHGDVQAPNELVRKVKALILN